MGLWLRQIELMAGSKSFNGDDFRIEFDVPFSTSKDPDIAEVSIYNLSKESISAIESKAYTILNVGYKGDIGNILSGKVESISTKWDKVDKITTIKVSDGGFEWRNTRIQKTYAKGSTAKYIMQDLSGLLGLEVAEVSPKNDITYQLGRTISGDVEKALKGLVADTDSKMYINKGKLYIRDKNKGTSIGFLLNSDTGLLGSPEKVEEENAKKKKVTKYNVKCLLNHKITTDSIIQIESRTVSGNYRVESGSHICNGSEFITEMVVVPM